MRIFERDVTYIVLSVYLLTLTSPIILGIKRIIPKLAYFILRHLNLNLTSH